MTIHTLSHDEHDELLRLRAWKAKADERQAQRLRCKVSEKGAVSVYGMGKWPVTLYKSQWDALIAFMPHVKAFIDENSDSLSSKLG